VVDPDVGWLVDVDVVANVVVGNVVGTLVVLVSGAAMGVNGPGLTCSPAAATICHARTVVMAVAVTQIAIRPKRFTLEFSQQTEGYRINRVSRFSQGLALRRSPSIPC
jgi:branched-subunit amino acid ABC-type transport system permease component